VTTYNTVAASIVIFYDYVLTLGDEVDLIWRSKFTWVNILFYVIRYLTIFVRMIHLVFCTNVFGLLPVTPSGCLLWQWFQVMSGQILFLIVEILLITRVFAYYGRHTPLLIVLLFLLAVEFSAMVALVATSLPNGHIIPSLLTDNIHAGSCIGKYMPARFASLWIPPLIMQGIVSSLITGKFIWSRLDAQTSSSPLLVVFIRDHVWAFLLIFAVSMWSTLAYQLTIYDGQVALTWNYSVLGFCGSRLILNLREAAYASDNSPLEAEISDIKFKSNPSRLSLEEVPGTTSI